MPHIEYVPKKFSPASLKVIRQAEAICSSYAAQGYDLTLRQLYYQFVSRDLIANKQSEYKRLGSIINDARLAGLLDWDYIVDRTRNLRELPSWNAPTDIVRSSARQFRIDKWADQSTRVEVWIEKDALVGVIEGVCNGQQVPFFSCRGYTSQSEVWGAAQRIGVHIRNGQNVTIVHLGDHDPSGIDMTRDIEDRLRLFLQKDNTQKAIEANWDAFEKAWADTGTSSGKELREEDPERYAEVKALIDQTYASYGTLWVNRIALNMDQIEQYDPPPNPAKITDSRAEGYIAIHGEQSWELDALEPTVLGDLITAAIEEDRDEDLWEQALEREDEHKSRLTQIVDRWEEITEFLGEVS